MWVTCVSHWFISDADIGCVVGLVGHSSTYSADINSIYVVPGHEPDEYISTEHRLYILDITKSVWSKRLYHNLVRLVD